MGEEIAELAKFRLEKAYDDYIASKILLENKLYTQSINRSYYSIFHSARALLAFEKLDAKKHSGVISLFYTKFIKSNKIEKSFHTVITSAERIRINTDYKDFFIVSKSETKRQVSDALKFYERVKKYIEQNYSD